MNRDLEEDRISPGWQVHLAQMYGKKGDFERAVELIEQAYEQNTEIKDGFARLGWNYALTQDWVGASSLMCKDLEKKRLSSEWQIKLAMMYGCNGEFNNALHIIENLYSSCKLSTDGYARLGWACYMASGDNHRFQICIDKDGGLNRLSDQGRRTSAVALSVSGEHLAACKLMELLYSENENLKDGFAVLGWLRIEQGFIEEGLALMDQDYQLRRLSSIWLANYTYQLALAGELKARLMFAELSSLEPYQQEFRIGYQLIPVRIMLKCEFEEMLESV